MLHSLFPRAYGRFLSLPLLGPVADGFDDWLAANGYTRVSRQNSLRMLRMWMPNFDAVKLRSLPWSKDPTVLDWLESL
jgi:hypothetical protein